MEETIIKLVIPIIAGTIVVLWKRARKKLIEKFGKEATERATNIVEDLFDEFEKQLIKKDYKGNKNLINNSGINEIAKEIKKDINISIGYDKKDGITGSIERTFIDSEVSVGYGKDGISGKFKKVF